jgi:hypothetical protein
MGLQVLELDFNEKAALTSALDNYLNGVGMEQDDEDEGVLEGLLAHLENL